MATEATPPFVFISYSHDDDDHKKWVKEFATILMANGIDVMLDQWDLGLGDDVVKFMEVGVRDTDRVLMICTEKYVAKANDGVGGVGYEAMVVTGELVRNLGVAKFIPVIRQKDGKSQVPTSVSTRRYIDFSDGTNGDVAMDELLRDLHRVPTGKPPVGKSPFAASAPAALAAPAVAAVTSEEPEPDEAPPAGPPSYYDWALAAAQANNILRWRRVVSHARSGIRPALTEWVRKYGGSIPATNEELVEQTMEGANAFAPLTAVALAGVASGNPKFQNQTGQLEDVLDLPEWQRSGYTIRVELPEAGAFVYQALHGAMCLNVGNLAAAMRLARVPTRSRLSNQTVPLWQRHEIVMWPESLGKSVSATWQTALALASRWEWVAAVFGDVTDYQAAVYAYYLSLNVLEYSERLRAGKPLPEPMWFRPDIPPEFERTPADVKRRGYRLVVDAGAEFRTLWSSMNVTEIEIRDKWPQWLDLQNYLLHQLYPMVLQLSYGQLIPEIVGS